MTARTYKTLALSWVPDSQETRSFYLICAAVMAIALALGVILSSIQVPEKERRALKVIYWETARN